MDRWKLEPAHDAGLPFFRRLRSVDRESGLIETALHVAWWRVVRIYLRLAHRVRIEGREHLPREGPFVLVANHQSHLDALVLTAQLPWRLRIRAHPIAAADTFFDNAITSALSAATINALPVQRGRTGAHALEHLRTRLIKERCVYVLFPEGTRTRDGAIGRFKPGVGLLLAGTDVPVVPCHLAGSFEALPPHRHVPRFLPIRLKIGPAIRFTEVPNDRDGWIRIADVLEQQVRGLSKENAV